MARSKVFCSKHEIIDVAIALVEAEGSEALTARRIAKELGVSSATMYNYVSNLWELRREVVLWGMHLLYQQIYDGLAQEQATSTTQACLRIATDIWDFAMGHKKLFQMIFVTEKPVFSTELETAPFYALFLRLFPKKRRHPGTKRRDMALTMLNHTVLGLITDVLNGSSTMTKADYTEHIDYCICAIAQSKQKDDQT